MHLHRRIPNFCAILISWSLMQMIASLRQASGDRTVQMKDGGAFRFDDLPDLPGVLHQGRRIAGRRHDMRAVGSEPVDAAGQDELHLADVRRGGLETRNDAKVGLQPTLERFGNVQYFHGRPAIKSVRACRR
jgi:hypothetical protein